MKWRGRKLRRANAPNAASIRPAGSRRPWPAGFTPLAFIASPGLMRAIALIVLVPFVMTCTGCSSRYAADPAIDPVADDEPLEIVAYVLADGSRVQWHGTIYGVSSDSLEFRRHEDKTKPKQGLFDQTDGDPAPKRSVFRLPRTEVTSVEVLDRHEVRTLAMVVPIVVVFVFLMLVIGSGIYSGPLLSESS